MTRVQLPEELIDRIEDLLDEYGYKSKAEFVREAVRMRADELESKDNDLQELDSSSRYPYSNPLWQGEDGQGTGAPLLSDLLDSTTGSLGADTLSMSAQSITIETDDGIYNVSTQKDNSGDAIMQIESIDEK